MAAESKYSKFPPCLSPDGRSYAFTESDGFTVRSIALFQSPAPGRPWVAAGEFAVRTSIHGDWEQDPWRAGPTPLSDSVGMAWSPGSSYLFVASADPMTLWKLDARSGLTVVSRVSLTLDIEFLWMASSLCLSGTGDHLLLKSDNHDSLLVVGADHLGDPIQLRRPHACRFIGKASGLNWSYSLPGENGRWLGIPSLRPPPRHGVRIVPIGSDMILRCGNEREPLLWYSLTLGKWAEIEVEVKYLNSRGRYRGYGGMRMTAFDGRWLTFSSQEKGVLYCADTRLLAAFKTGPLNRQRFFSACRRISVPESIYAIQTLGENAGKKDLHDRPWLVIFTPECEGWLAYIEGNDLTLEGKFSQYRTGASSAGLHQSTPVSTLLAAGADGVSVLTLSTPRTSRRARTPSKRLRAEVTPKGLRNFWNRELKTVVSGPASICYKGPDFLPRNQRVLARWLARIDAGIARRASPGHSSQNTTSSKFNYSWLYKLSSSSPEAFDLIVDQISLNERAILTLAYPDLASVIFGSTHAQLMALATWIEVGTNAAPAVLQRSTSGYYEYMGDAALDLLMALTEAGDRIALQMALYAYRMGIGGASSECEVASEQRSMASALANRLAIVENGLQTERLRREW